MTEVTPSVPLRVLLVDDCIDMTTSMAILLRCWGYETREAHNGTEALAVAVAFRPDVVFLDVGMPGEDGYQVARRMRKEASLEHAFLASLTGFTGPEERLRSCEAGCDQHFVKPLDPVVLHGILEACKKARNAAAPLALANGASIAVPERAGIAERAESRLRRNSYLALNNISCECSDGVLTLRGSLASYYLKQVAQTTAAAVEGVERIDNQIVVTSPDAGGRLKGP